MKSDASAACGIARRRGLGKVRHIEVSQLWLQDLVARGKVHLFKIPGEHNLSDMLTKHVPVTDIERHMRSMNMTFESGRHTEAPSLSISTSSDS